jgi:signal peptidase I
MSEWRPKPWIAAVLGLFFGGVGLLYVQRPWFAVAYFVASYSAALAVLFAALTLDVSMPMQVVPWIGWIVGVACGVHSYAIAKSTHSAAERKWYLRWYGLTAFPVVTLAVTFLIRAFMFEPFNVPSESMYPTIPQGSYIFVSKAGFGGYGTFGITVWRGQPTATIERGDLVAHRLVKDPATTYLGRIIGLPGDRIEYNDYRLVVNGTVVPSRLDVRDDRYQYVVEHLNGSDVTIALMPQRPSQNWSGLVPPDHYFVLGDSRDNARDSRFIGFIPRDHLLGRIVKILPPASAHSTRR